MPDGTLIAIGGHEDRDGERLILTHAEVPEPLRGRGIAGRLVHAAVQRAERSGETVVPRCPYTRSWLRSHPSEAERVTIDWEGGTVPPEPAGD